MTILAETSAESKRYKDSLGYVRVRDSEGVCGKRNAVVLEHRLVMARVLGRPLRSNEYVHHIDNNRSNNDPSNLEIVSKDRHHEGHQGPVKSQQTFYLPYPAFEGDVPWLKLRCPTCTRVFYRRKSQVGGLTFCSAKCKRDYDNNQPHEPNVICEFETNDDFMHVYLKRCGKRHLIDDDGVFHAPKRGYWYRQGKN